MSEMWTRLIHNICALNYRLHSTHASHNQWRKEEYDSVKKRDRGKKSMRSKENKARSFRKSIYFYSCEYVYRKHVGCIVNRGSFVIIIGIVICLLKKPLCSFFSFLLFNLVRFGLTRFFGIGFVTFAAFFKAAIQKKKKKSDDDFIFLILYTQLLAR